MSEKYLLHSIDKKLIKKLKLKLLYWNIFKPSEYKKALHQIAKAKSLSKAMIKLAIRSDIRDEDYITKREKHFDEYTSEPTVIGIIEQYKAELFLETISKIYLIQIGETI